MDKIKERLRDQWPDKLNLVNKIKLEQIKNNKTINELEPFIPLLFWFDTDSRLAIPEVYTPHGYIDFRPEIRARERFMDLSTKLLYKRKIIEDFIRKHYWVWREKYEMRRMHPKNEYLKQLVNNFD